MAVYQTSHGNTPQKAAGIEDVPALGTNASAEEPQKDHGTRRRDRCQQEDRVLYQGIHNFLTTTPEAHDGSINERHSDFTYMRNVNVARLVWTLGYSRAVLGRSIYEEG